MNGIPQQNNNRVLKLCNQISMSLKCTHFLQKLFCRLIASLTSHDVRREYYVNNLVLQFDKHMNQQVDKRSNSCFSKS